MREMELQQPVIRQKQFEYESAPFIQKDYGYCYQFVANEDFVIVPDGNMHILWNLDKQEVVSFYPDRFQIIRNFIYMEGTKQQYFCISISYKKSVTIMEEELKKFSRELFRLHCFDEKCEFCNQQFHHIFYTKSNHPLLTGTMDEIIKTQGRTAIESIAAEQGYSVRQMERVFLNYDRCSPKTMCRLIRMEYVLNMMEKYPEYSFSLIAEKMGFSDSPHMLREFKYFAGMTPKEFAVQYFHKSYY